MSIPVSTITGSTYESIRSRLDHVTPCVLITLLVTSLSQVVGPEDAVMIRVVAPDRVKLRVLFAPAVMADWIVPVFEIHVLKTRFALAHETRL